MKIFINKINILLFLNRVIKPIIFFIPFLVPKVSYAQDSLKQSIINIYSTYQPILKDAAKLNLSASLPLIDTSKPSLIYNVPIQNFNLNYQPFSIMPIEWKKDTSPNYENNLVEAGFGNYSTTSLKVGLSGRNIGKSNYSIFFNHISSKGNIQNQDFGNDNLILGGQYFSGKFTFNGNLNLARNSLYYYGYNHDTLNYKKSDIHQVFTTFSMNLAMENSQSNVTGFTFSPRLKLSDFFDAYHHLESTFYINIPIRKKISNGIFIGVNFIGDYSTFSNMDSSFSLSNNLSEFHPALDIQKPGFLLHAGVNPTWNNQNFFLLPDIVNETNLIRNKLVLTSGWISYYLKNSYEYLTNKNPFLRGYSGFQNTRVEEKYSGIKGLLGKHFSYNSKFSYITYTDMPLYLNDSITAKTFYTIYDKKIQAYQLHGEIEYNAEENLQLGIKMNWFNYFKLSNDQKPWGLLPFQADFSIIYIPINSLRLTSEVFALSGSWFLQAKKTNKTKGAIDANFGISYQINKNFEVWANLNNMFNTQYQRWHNYPSLGLNALGGIVISF